MVVHKENEQKMILPSLLNRYINKGWVKGKPKSPTAGMVWIYHCELDKYTLCENHMLEQQLSQGWIRKKMGTCKERSLLDQQSTRKFTYTKGRIRKIPF